MQCCVSSLEKPEISHPGDWKFCKYRFEKYCWRFWLFPVTRTFRIWSSKDFCKFTNYKLQTQKIRLDSAIHLPYINENAYIFIISYTVSLRDSFFFLCKTMAIHNLKIFILQWLQFEMTEIIWRNELGSRGPWVSLKIIAHRRTFVNQSDWLHRHASNRSSFIPFTNDSV